MSPSITDFHAKYYAYDLTLKRVEGVDRLSRALFDAQVDLNPHQIEAALFALQSPLSKGVILADEVGLGKTIEAGIILCQLWAERKRRQLIICPAAIRKQWEIELEEKFNLPATVLDAKAYKQAVRSGNPRPFDNNQSVLICSYQFASKHREEIRSVPFDLVTIDEAHKLRNCYRESNKTGQALLWALEDRKKLLLTATPLQISLLEIYGLASLIDGNIFGDSPASFRSQFMRADSDLDALKDRMGDFCKRTLRADVKEYINYTERKALTQPFTPTDREQQFYDRVSAFLQRDDSYSIPEQYKHLILLRLRKLLASSSFAIISTLEKTLQHLYDLRDGKEEAKTRHIGHDLVKDEDLDDDVLEQLLDEIEAESNDSLAPLTVKDLGEETRELEDIITLGKTLGLETKMKAITEALSVGLSEMKKNGAAEKALIFTESRRTQDALKDYLENNGYRGKVILFNGSNNGPEVKALYENWITKNAGTSRASGSRPVDSRTALIEHFRDEATILIATEAAAEGVNMQFCSLLINFDLPWNPQRVEQRIGRVHRYGQKHDVVVINFINQRNQADTRVHQLLTERFRLFDSVFGASDDILGTIDSNKLDFEQRVLNIYQTCRDPQEIERAFNTLQEELSSEIESRMEETQQLLMDNFDEDVHSRLRIELAAAQTNLDAFSKRFWQLSTHLLSDYATFDKVPENAFNLESPPAANIPTGLYHLISKNKEQPTSHSNQPGHLYRLTHPLGEWVIQEGKTAATPIAELHFDISAHPTKIALIQNLKGRSGYLRLTHLHLQSYEDEDHLLFSAFTDEGASLDQETCQKLFNVGATTRDTTLTLPPAITDRLSAETTRHTEATISSSLEHNNQHFHQARERLDRWAEDAIHAAEQAIRDTKEQIRRLTRESRTAENLSAQKEIQEQIKKLEQKKNRQRREIFDKEDEITDKRDDLIADLERRLTSDTSTQELFTLRWRII